MKPTRYRQTGVSIVVATWMLATGCESISKQARLDAIGRMMRGDLAGASHALSNCEREPRESELYLCLALRADIAFRRSAFSAAEKDYRTSLAIRARIKKTEGFGTVSAYSLFSWAFAARWTKAADARAIELRALAAAESNHRRYGDGALLLAAARWLANRSGAPSHKRRLTPHACNIREVRYFNKAPHARYFPKQVWRALASVCGQP